MLREQMQIELVYSCGLCIYRYTVLFTHEAR